MKDAAAFWDREVVAPTHTSWMAHPDVRRHMNELVSGNPDYWPMDWFVAQYRDVSFDRALSIGCGTGALERDLIGRGLCRQVDAFDGSQVSIEIAAAEAQKAGIGDRVNYFVADFNEPRLPANTYDAVFFHQSAHHVAKLEKLFRAVLRTLKPDGIVYFDEFVGPSRTEWNDELLGPARAVYRVLPREHRQGDDVPLPIQDDDPSEAIRSSEILPQLRIGFEIDALRGYGGNILSVLFPLLRAPSDELVRQLIEAEREVLRAGEPSFYALIVARPKRGVAAIVASARYRGVSAAIAGVRYFVGPKLARLRRRARAALRRK